MSFSEDVKFERFINMLSDFRCECTNSAHGHGSRCRNSVDYRNPGREGSGAWEAHHIIPEAEGGSNAIDNCRVYCWPCHEKTLGK